MGDRVRDLMRLGEAASAITRCTELLGEDAANRILAQIEAAAGQVRGESSSG